MDGKDTADQQRIETEHGQLGAIGVPEARDRVVAGADRHEFRLPQLVDEPHTARMEIEVAAVPAVEAGPRCRIAAAVVETAKFLIEVVGRYRSTDVQIERLGIDTRRHGPQTPLKFMGHEAIEVHDPGRGDGCEHDAREAGNDE